MRNETLRDAKAELRRWFARQPSDYLTRVVDECRSGAFAFSDCCHCVRGLTADGYLETNSAKALRAEQALAMLCDIPWTSSKECPWQHAAAEDRLSRVRTLPIVLAEIRRRTKQPVESPAQEAVTVE